MGAYLREIRKGADSYEAWAAAKEGILADKMRYGLWEGDKLVEDTAKVKNAACSASEIR